MTLVSLNVRSRQFTKSHLSGSLYKIPATPFFYKNSFYKNHQAQNCQKIKNILKIMARLKYMTNNLESSILILHQESALFTVECLLFTMEGLQRKSIKTQLIEHRIEWKAIIITLKEMSGRKRLIRFKINEEKLRINYEYFRVILTEVLRIARLRSDLCNSYKKNGVELFWI